MLKDVDKLIGEKLTLVGIEERLVDENKGLKPELRTIEPTEANKFDVIYQHDSHRVRVKIGVAADTGSFDQDDYEDIRLELFVVDSVNVEDIE